MRGKLESHGYTDVRNLVGADANVPNLVESLSASPGFVFFHSHGGPGMISTGVALDARDCRKAFRAELAKLDPSYHSLLVYGNGSVASPKTLKIGRLDHALIDGRQYYICLHQHVQVQAASAR